MLPTPLWALLAAVTLAVAQSVTPSNSSNYVPSSESQRLQLAVQRGGWGNRRPMPFADVIPLTDAALSQFQSGALTGPVYLADESTLNNISPSSVAFIDCNPSSYRGLIQAVQVLRAAAERNATAALLYSTTSLYCNYTAGEGIPSTYTRIYSMVSPADSLAVLGQIQRSQSGSYPFVATIGSQSNVEALQNSSNDNSNNSNNNGNQSAFGPSPSTAVAMIILYSITGVITALFLVIIITGAVRAHRHPERYGPRNVLGRPRQSRARGMARAVLDTIPIVKFGERNPVKPTDIELASATSNPTQPRSSPAAEAAAPTTDATQPPTPPPRPSAEGIAPAAAAAAATTSVTGSGTTPEEDSGLGCSICTDDFERGQEMRVLPCNHAFHPACVDPWLLNVSGTCPLCRVDLRPTTSRASAGSIELERERRASLPGAAAAAPPPPPPPLLEQEQQQDGVGAAAGARGSRRLSRIADVLSLRRMQDAPPGERIAALRRWRAENAGVGEDEVGASRRRRLAARLQDAFSVRTRRVGNGEVGDVAASGGEATSRANV